MGYLDERAHYLKETPISLASASVLDSGTLKLLVHHKEEALRNMIKKIGNGADTFLWYDNWIKNCSFHTMSGLQLPPQLFSRLESSGYIKGWEVGNEVS